MRLIPLSSEGMFVPYSTHNMLTAGFNPRTHVYPNRVCVRCCAEGDVLKVYPDRGMMVQGWRWHIAAVGVHTLQLTTDADGRRLASCDYLTPSVSVVQDIDDVLGYSIAVGQVTDDEGAEWRNRAIHNLTDTSRCLMWAYLRRGAENLTGHVWDWQEYLTDAVILMPRCDLPIGITGGTTDLRRPFPVQLF